MSESTDQPGARRPLRRHSEFDENEGFWQRIMPRTILGMAALLFFMSIASALSGAALFAYYRFELDDTRQRVADVESSISDQVEASQQVIDAETKEAQDLISDQLAQLEQFTASGQTLDELIEGVKDSVFFVSTLDEAGQPSVGSAFVLFSDSERSFLITSYTTVRAATASPGPGITVRNDGNEIAVDLSTWDERRDLALLVAEESPNLPPIEVATGDYSTGDRVFAVSGLGAQGGSVVQGVIADVAQNGISHDAPIGVQFQGGPLLNSNGRLIGITSRMFSPSGFIPDTVFFGIPVSEACAQVVQCPERLGG